MTYNIRYKDQNNNWQTTTISYDERKDGLTIIKDLTAQVGYHPMEIECFEEDI
jgi:dolichyl-phosphate-mannose--protein O-mannosyl transferase